jgi:dihydroorotate dehydrogenase (fumarate)
MNLRTRYLGLDLAHPFLPGASPLVDDLDMVRRLEDAGAPAIVMHSLFEEQVALELAQTFARVSASSHATPEALGFFPAATEFTLGPQEYLEQVRRIRETVSVPVIGSLNGLRPSGWLRYARLIQEAGASALELNVYRVPTDADLSGADLEAQLLEVVRTVTAGVTIRVAVKLSPFYSSLPHLARGLERAGAAGLVLFNRFYQPDIDIEGLEVDPVLHLSTSSELLLRVRWLAILSGRTRLSLAASGGVHEAPDAIKALMAGADAVQMVSALLRHGPERLGALRDAVVRWLTEHEYPSLDHLRGSMNLARCPSPASFERTQYLRVLHGGRRVS